MKYLEEIIKIGNFLQRREVIHALLSYNIFYIRQQVMGIVPMMKEVLRKIMSATESTYCNKNFFYSQEM
jgi:hypothetical protein